jgi:circadian clock protein KaiC
VPWGIPALDQMFDGEGLYQGSSVLISGAAGTGKSTIAAGFVDAACRRGERALYFAFEESPQQIMRNMRSVGIDLEQWVDAGLLRIHSERPQNTGLEMHLVRLNREVDEFRPVVAAIDPITNLTSIGTYSTIRGMLTRMIDTMKSKEITTVFTSLTEEGSAERTDVGVSSLMDTWLLVRNLEVDGRRTRGLYVLKARGIAHSNEIREFRLSDGGIELADSIPAAHVFGSGQTAGAWRSRRLRHEHRHPQL